MSRLARCGRLADLIDAEPDQFCLLRDDHYLAVFFDRKRSDDLAGLFGRFHIDDAETAAFCQTIACDLCLFAEALFRYGKDFLVALFFTAQTDTTKSPLRRLTPRTPRVARPIGRTSDSLKRTAIPSCVARKIWFLAIRADHVEQLVASVDIDRVDAVRADVLIIGQRGLFDHAVARDHCQEQLFAKIADRHDGNKFSLRRELDQIDDRFAASSGRRFGYFVDLDLKDLSVFGEDHQVGVCRSDEKVLDKVVIFRGRAEPAFTAAPLPRVCRNRRSFDVAGLCNGDRDILVLDQVLDIKFRVSVDDNGSPLVSVLFLISTSSSVMT